MAKKMIACDEAGFLISKSRDAKLTFREKMGLKIHLMTCHLCRKYEKQIIQLNKLIGRYKEQCTHENCCQTLDDKARQDLLHLLQNELDK